jgi:hypothetical protein
MDSKIKQDPGSDGSKVKVKKEMVKSEYGLNFNLSSIPMAPPRPPYGGSKIKSRAQDVKQSLVPGSETHVPQYDPTGEPNVTATRRRHRYWRNSSAHTAGGQTVRLNDERLGIFVTAHHHQSMGVLQLSVRTYNWEPFAA